MRAARCTQGVGTRWTASGTLGCWSAATGRAARTLREKVVDGADVMLVGRDGTVLSRANRDPSRPGQGSRRRWRRRGRGASFEPSQARAPKAVKLKFAF